MANALESALQYFTNWAGKTVGAVGSFIQNNPTPSSYVQQQLTPVVQKFVQSVQSAWTSPQPSPQQYAQQNFQSIPQRIAPAVAKFTSWVTDAGNQLNQQAQGYLNTQQTLQKQGIYSGYTITPARAAVTDYQKQIQQMADKLPTFKLYQGNPIRPQGFDVNTGAIARGALDLVTGGAYSPEEQSFLKKVNAGRTDFTPQELVTAKQLQEQEMIAVGGVINAPVSKTIRYVGSKMIGDAIREIGSTAKSPDEMAVAISRYVDAYKQTADAAQLKEMRAGLVKELTNLTGGSGNYKKDYAMRVALRNDEQIGTLVRSLEDHVNNIDVQLTKPQPLAPLAVTNPQTVPALPGPLPWETRPIMGGKPEATQRLKNLLTYQEDMKRIGYGIPGGRPIPDVNTSMKILAGEIPQYYNKQAIDKALISEEGMNMASRFTKTFQPIKALTPDLQEAVRHHASAVNVAKINADELAQTFKSNLSPQLEWKLVQYSQEPTLQMARRLNLSQGEIAQGVEIINKSRQFNDQLFSKAKTLGVDMGYLQNHIYQIFKESPDKVDDILQAKGLGGKPGFAHHRTIPTFVKGQELGLTPKFTTFSQLNAAANEALDKAVANQSLAKTLEKSGQLLPQMQAPANWERITARWFPKATVKVGHTNTLQQDWYAPKQLAAFLNNYFGGQQMQTGQKILNVAAQGSGVVQNIVLSGGIGPLNWFGVGQMIKEGAAGRFVTPIKAFLRAYVPGASAKFQANNSQVMREMAQEGITIRGLETYQTMYRNIVSNPKISEVIGSTWHKLMDEPTFGKFMKELEIGFYQDTKAALIKNGTPERYAIGQAADAVKKFYGKADNLGRAQGIDDLMTTVFLAPRYREGMLNIFANLAKSLKPGNWSNSSSDGLRKLTVGMALTYGAYNVLNFRLNGHFMWDNPPGKEFELVMPVGDPKDRKYISVPWMPGFTAVPRRILGTIWATAKGDPLEAIRQFSSLFSIPISKAGEFISNKDYFGNEVYDPNKPLPGLALWGAKSFLPGYGRAAVDVATGKATPAFGLVEALELPLRKGTFSTGYFEAIDQAKKTLSSEERKQLDFMLTADAKGGPGTDAEAEMMLKNANLLKAKQTVKLGTNPNDPLWSRPFQDIQGYLAYQLSQDTAQKAQIRVAFPWIPQVQYALSQDYYTSVQKQVTPTTGYDPQSLQGQLGTLLNPAKPFTGTVPTPPTASPMQQLSPEQVQIASTYTALPKYSAARKQLLAQNPWLRSYWNANEQYYSQNPYQQTGPLADFLASMNISPMAAYASSSSRGGSVGKKVSFKKIKIGSVKLSKAPSTRRLKLRMPKFTYPKPIATRRLKVRGLVSVPKMRRLKLRSIASYQKQFLAMGRKNALQQALASGFRVA